MQENSPYLGAGVWHQADSEEGGGWTPGSSLLLLELLVLEASIEIQSFSAVLSYSETGINLGNSL